MPTGIIAEHVSAASGAIFHFAHDYTRRLEWDTPLRSAYLEDGYDQADLSAISVCTGKWRFGGIAIRTEYVAFQPGSLAAVKMINRPPLFESFAASIRHQNISPAQSTIIYRFAFTARPRWLRFILHPVMSLILRIETRRRLRALRNHVRREQGSAEPCTTS